MRDNVERFLVAVNRKQPIAFEPVRRQIAVEDVRGHISEEIQILKKRLGAGAVVGEGPRRFSVRGKELDRRG